MTEYTKLITNFDDQTAKKTRREKLGELQTSSEDICCGFIKERLLQISEDLTLMGFAPQVSEDIDGDPLIDLTTDIRIILGVVATVLRGNQIVNHNECMDVEITTER
ncbi:MAG: hypothetical protein ABJ327_11175 [Litoreibacter sp.]